MAKRTRKQDPARELAIEAARVAQDDLAEDIVVLNLHEISPVTDYFVICTGTSDRQMRTVAEDVISRGKALGHKAWHVAGMEAGDWILVDFVDVVVHVFSEEQRRYYDLEMIWGAAPRVRWRKPKRSSAPTEDGSSTEES